MKAAPSECDRKRVCLANTPEYTVIDAPWQEQEDGYVIYAYTHTIGVAAIIRHRRRIGTRSNAESRISEVHDKKHTRIHIYQVPESVVRSGTCSVSIPKDWAHTWAPRQIMRPDIRRAVCIQGTSSVRQWHRAAAATSHTLRTLFFHSKRAEHAPEHHSNHNLTSAITPSPSWLSYPRGSATDTGSLLTRHLRVTSTFVLDIS
jgi:hypothetical protein